MDLEWFISVSSTSIKKESNRRTKGQGPLCPPATSWKSRANARRPPVGSGLVAFRQGSSDGGSGVPVPDAPGRLLRRRLPGPGPGPWALHSEQSCGLCPPSPRTTSIHPQMPLVRPAGSPQGCHGLSDLAGTSQATEARLGPTPGASEAGGPGTAHSAVRPRLLGVGARLPNLCHPLRARGAGRAQSRRLRQRGATSSLKRNPPTPAKTSLVPAGSQHCQMLAQRTRGDQRWGPSMPWRRVSGMKAASPPFPPRVTRHSAYVSSEHVCPESPPPPPPIFQLQQRIRVTLPKSPPGSGGPSR